MTMPVLEYIDYGECEWFDIENFHAGALYYNLVLGAATDWEPKLVWQGQLLVPPPHDKDGAGELEGMFCAFICAVNNHLDLLAIADDVRMCTCFTPEVKENLLFNISLKLYGKTA